MHVGLLLKLGDPLISTGAVTPDAALLVALLPRLIHVRGQQRLSMLVQLIRSEAQDNRPAREMVLERLLQVLLIEALRSASDNMASPGLVRGLADARLATAIRRMHEEPARQWTVEQFANEAALSRSVFFDRFRKEVDTSGRMAGLDAFTQQALGVLTDSKLAQALDISHEPDYVTLHPGPLGSELVLPLQVKGRIIGVLDRHPRRQGKRHDGHGGHGGAAFAQ